MSNYLINFLQDRKTVLRALCKKYKVRSLYAFGSSVKEDFNPETSDIDLMVYLEEADPLKKGELLLNLFLELEDFFRRRVDLLTDQPIKNAFLAKEIDSSKVLIYDGAREKILI